MNKNFDPDALKFYRVQAPHMVAGVVCMDGIIVDGAPILKWTRGKTIKWFKKYCKNKKWEIGVI